MGNSNITCIAKIGILSLVFIDNVLHVEGLKYNLLSISQFFDSGYIVSFNIDQCLVKTEDVQSFFTSRRHNNLYGIDLISVSKQNEICLPSREDERWIFHKGFQNYPKRIS